MIQVLIVDDHTIVREGLKQIRAETSDIGVAGEAPNGREALQKIRAGRYDIVLFDVAMPEMNGLTVLTTTTASRAASWAS